VECIQGEDGVNKASPEWLRAFAQITAEREIPPIVDDIQAGCGRPGDFFSFEESGIRLNFIPLSKTLPWYCVPMSLLLIRPELDIWAPGGHTGTFRGNNLGFVRATSALRVYWSDGLFSADIKREGAILHKRLAAIAARHPGELEARGRGLLWGLASTVDPDFGTRVSRAAFASALIAETAGAWGEVIKFLPALTIDDADRSRGIDIVEQSIHAMFSGA
jgi:diaminobutyrate-2-oxoglutarate transaminase